MRILLQFPDLLDQQFDQVSGDWMLFEGGAQ
jgi:hypothetical protein